MAFRPAPVDNAGQREVISQQAQDRRRLPGRLAQLVEHLVYTEEVGGSTPSPPTKRPFCRPERPHCRPINEGGGI